MICSFVLNMIVYDMMMMDALGWSCEISGCLFVDKGYNANIFMVTLFSCLTKHVTKLAARLGFMVYPTLAKYFFFLPAAFSFGLSHRENKT